MIFSLIYLVFHAIYIGKLLSSSSKHLKTIKRYVSQIKIFLWEKYKWFVYTTRTIIITRKNIWELSCCSNELACGKD